VTPFELCRGYLTYMDGWKAIWARKIADVEESVKESASRLTSKPRTNDRNAEHKLRRDTLALFHRFLTGEKAHTPYPDIAAKEIAVWLDKGAVVEEKLAREMLVFGREKVSGEVRKFQSFVAQETALLEAQVRETLG